MKKQNRFEKLTKNSIKYKAINETFVTVINLNLWLVKVVRSYIQIYQVSLPTNSLFSCFFRHKFLLFIHFAFVCAFIYRMKKKCIAKKYSWKFLLEILFLRLLRFFFILFLSKYCCFCARRFLKFISTRGFFRIELLEMGRYRNCIRHILCKRHNGGEKCDGDAINLSVESNERNRDKTKKKEIEIHRERDEKTEKHKRTPKSDTKESFSIFYKSSNCLYNTYIN